MSPELSPKAYRGVDRSPLSSVPRAFDVEFSVMEPEAQFRLFELEEQGRALDGRMFDFEDAKEILGYLNDRPSFELIHVTSANNLACEDPQCLFVGYDVAYLGGDHYSAVCNCMFFPSWWGTDEAGELYRENYQKLNEHGLFGRVEDARGFYQHYVQASGDNGRDLETLEVHLPTVVA